MTSGLFAASAAEPSTVPQIDPCPVAHVMLGAGNPSETFIGHAVEAVARRGWRPSVLALARNGPVRGVADERIVATGPMALTQRAHDLLRWRSPQERFAQQVAEQARTWGVGLLHAHFGWSAVYAAPLARRLELPLVVTFYGTDASVPARATRRARGRLPGRRWNPYESVFDTATRVVAVSEYVVDRLRALGYGGRVELIRNAVDVARIPARIGAPPARDGFRVLFVGRLVHVKGADVLLRALPAILERAPCARVELVGDGVQRRALERLARSLGIDAAVTFRGTLPHAAVLEAINNAHLVVVPSRVLPGGSAESSSMVFKEALMLGVRVIATRSGGLVETCPPELRHELVLPDDPGQLAGAVLRALTDGGASAERIEAGRRWGTEQFGPQRLGQALDACYRAALRRR